MGRPHVQREISLAHFIYQQQQQELPRAKPEDPPQYKTVTVRVQVPQNSIIGFTGEFDMQLSEREKGYALYNGFVVNAQLAYDVVNDSDQNTEVDWVLPMSPGQTLFEGFKILIDDQDMSSRLRFGGDQITWQTKMQAHQRSRVVITYNSRGMDYLYYQLPNQRQINNFNLTLKIDKLPTSLLNYPEGILAPTQVTATPDGQGSIVTWKFDRAITVAGMGVALPQPEQPGAKVFRVMNSSSFALTLFVVMVALTLLILKQPINLFETALFAAAYSAQIFVMAGLSDYALGFWGSLIAGAILTLLLTGLLVHRQPLRLTRWLILGLTIFFTLVYPLSGLLTDIQQANAFDVLVQVGLVVYTVVLALYVSHTSNPSAQVPAPATAA